MELKLPLARAFAKGLEAVTVKAFLHARVDDDRPRRCGVAVENLFLHGVLQVLSVQHVFFLVCFSMPGHMDGLVQLCDVVSFLFFWVVSLKQNNGGVWSL